MTRQDYVPFSIANRLFYETPSRLPDARTRFAVSQRDAPSGWRRYENGMSWVMEPDGLQLPDQGWKIHISSTPGNADQVLDIVWPFCVRNRIAFKYLRSGSAVLATNSKYWNRSGSGKFVTLYPVDDAQFAFLLQSLEPELRSYHGPYILSDLRYCDGPLFVRYGAFRPLWLIDEHGAKIPAIRTPDRQLVPDPRGPVFSIPDFAAVPQLIERYVGDRPGQYDNFPYEIESALHFSNGGGIYLGRNSVSLEEVVLREARPHAGLDSRGDDAVKRLENERDMLSRLQGLDCVPKLIDQLKVWEHHFLITEYVPGSTLFDEIIRRYPLVHPDPIESDVADYVKWALGVFDRLERAIQSIHERGVNIVDLHPSNIMVRPNGDLVLIDFECSGALSEDSAKALGAEGFDRPDGLSGGEADYYALNCIRLMVLLPIVPVLALDSVKAGTLVRVACENLSIDPHLRRVLERGFSAGRDDHPAPDAAAEMFTAENPDWRSIRASLVAGILGAASPERNDRLFAGDPLQFTYGGATLAYGAAGVLLALDRVAAKIPPALVEWLSMASARENSCLGAGLYDGLHGVAYVLELLGARDAALDALTRAPTGTDVRAAGMFGGRSGIAMNLLHFAEITGEKKLLSSALRLGDEMADTILAENGALVPTSSGLLHGATGAALLCLRLYEKIGNQRYLDAAEKALRADLAFGAALPDGAFHIRAGSRYLVYMDGGSAGVGLVLARYLSHRAAPDLEAVLEGIYRGCRIPFVLQPGLFQGRAGLIATLSDSGLPENCKTALEQVRRLSWHALLHDGHLAFPGTGLTRMSYDLATGSAGVLMAIESAQNCRPFGLPFL
jgi:tRNA A-37 threonylcarbamoyl transferase component Bud32